MYLRRCLMMKFEIYIDNNEEFRFRLVEENGQVIIESINYCNKMDCKKGIESIRLNSSIDARYDRLVSKGRNPYFNLKSFNSQIIGTSKIFSSVGVMEQSIKLIKCYASKAKVIDLVKLSF